MAVVRANGKAGFDKHRLFYTQRDYGLFQCSTPCCQETFDNEAVIGEMVERQENRKVPAELLPVCPHCGSPLTMNLRCDDRFVEDACWHRAAERYESFLRTRAGQRMLFLELGVGYNTPGIIKYPFWRMTAQCEGDLCLHQPWRGRSPAGNRGPVDSSFRGHRRCAAGAARGVMSARQDQNCRRMRVVCSN